MNKFSDLRVGEKFFFATESERFNRIYGPFVKTSRDRYQATDGVKAYVDTTTTQVTRA